MERQLEITIDARPGMFEWWARQKLRDNERATKSKKITHVRFLCEICEQETTTTAPTAVAVGKRFETHDGCRPKDEWPPEREASPRGNPLDRARWREEVRRKLEEEEK